MREYSGTANKNQPVIDPALEKPLLKLHRAMDVSALWKAVCRLVSAAVPNHAVGLSLQQNPGVPVMAKWSRPMPDDFFTAEPLKRYAAQTSGKKLARLSELFPNRGSFVKSVFYRRYIAPQACAHGVVLCFCKRRKLICVIAILRAAKQATFSTKELDLLRRLYPQIAAALRRIESLERERSVRSEFEEFLGGLPLPTMILRWNLKPIFQNKAAREFWAIWEKGPEEARRTKATSPIPSDILDRCHVLKEQWLSTRARVGSRRRRRIKQEQVVHPRSHRLRATIQLKQINSSGVARPHFLIACEDLRQNGARSGEAACLRLPAFARLTRREQEVAGLVCEGRSNKEIADSACVSLQTVKKHLHSVFRKLQVPSRSRLVALLL